MKVDAKREKDSDLERAKSFGVISPKIIRSIVINPTHNVSIHQGMFDHPKTVCAYFLRKSAANVETATFTMVFPNRIVVKSRLGFFSNRRILLERGLFCSSSFLICIFVNEKKAVSDPEKNADKTKKMSIYSKYSSTIYLEWINVFLRFVLFDI